MLTRRLLVMTGIILTTILVVMDTTIVYVAAPAIKVALHATEKQFSWLMTYYILATVVLTLACGALSARFGVKRLYLAALAGFVAASVWCAAAQSIPEFVLARVVQGGFAAFAIPLAQVILLNLYPAEDHGKALGYWGGATMAAPILGPVIGGLVISEFGWRAIFLLNIPVGVAAFCLIAAALLPVPAQRRRFDLLGFFFLVAAAICFQLVLDRGPIAGWFNSIEIVVESAAGVLALLAFSLRTRMADEPLIPPALFRSGRYCLGVFGIFTVSGMLLAVLSILPSLLQTALGYSPTDSGLIIAIRGIGVMASMLLVSRVLKRTGPYVLILAGLICISGTLLLWVAAGEQLTGELIAWSGGVQGFGFGLTFVPLAILAYGKAPQELRADAAGLYAVSRIFGGGVGIALAATLHHHTGIAVVTQAQQTYATSFAVIATLAAGLFLVVLAGYLAEMARRRASTLRAVVS